ncbi:MAG: hypothetical protein SPL51_00200 [Lachnospiraceae bacterium]|nr:hypothetical protein [Lachnospiraceae bacterium]
MKKHRKLIWILIIIFIIAAIATGVTIFCLVTFNERDFVINSKNTGNEDVNISDDTKVYRNSDDNYSFVYKADAKLVEDNPNIYLYTVEEGEPPYIMIYYTKGKIKPEKYFKDYKKIVKKSYKKASFKKISQVHIGDKTLYMLRAEIKSEGSTYVIDRYIEIYKDCSVQYTIKSNHTGSEDEVLAGIIKSFCFDSKAYSNRNNSGNNDSNNTSDTIEYKDFSSVSNDKIGISMSVPEDLQMQEIPIGLYGQSDNIILFASYQNSDATGAAIYDADDFVNRIVEVDGLLQSQLGVDKVTINNGSEEQLGNYQAYEFPIQIETGGFKGSGKMYLINGSNNSSNTGSNTSSNNSSNTSTSNGSNISTNNSSNAGCYILYYVVSNEDKYTKAAEQCISSFSIDSEPQDMPAYQKYSDTTNKISFLYRTGITDNKAEDMGGIVGLELSEDSFIMVEITNTGTEGVNSAGDYMQQFVKLLKEDNSDIKYTISEISKADSGRYDFETVDISYNYEGKDRVLSLSCVDGSNGVIYRIYYSGITDEAEKLKILYSDILWSFRAD